MVDYEVLSGNDLSKIRGFIKTGGKMGALLHQDVVKVEPATDSNIVSSWLRMASTDPTFLAVALFACVVVFGAVLTVFMANRERVRRFVTGENRRVGNVYYVRPGIHATQPTEI